MFEPGQIIDRYRLDEVIHRGRTTVVYAATDLSGAGRRVAVKVLDPRYAADPDVRKRFADEAQIAAALDGHPHIVTVLKHGQFDDAPYLVTELVDGTSLAALLAGRPRGELIDVTAGLQILGQLAEALDYAHHRGAVHGDVSPFNVLVSMEAPTGAAAPLPAVYLTDFGVTMLRDADHFEEFAGTADYASPEQLSGELDARSDVYSLACVGYEMLTGRPPFGHLSTDTERATAHLQLAPPNASALRRDLPRDVDAVLARGLAKDRGQRYPTAAAFVKALRGVFPQSVQPRVASPARSFRTPPPIVAPAAARKTRRPAILAIGSVCVLLFAAVVVYLIARPGSQPAADSPSTTTTTTTTSTSTTTTTTTTTSTSTTTTATEAPRGPVALTGDSPEENFAIGFQERRAPSELAAANSPAYYYLEWVSQFHPGAPARPAMRGPDGGLLVMADQQVSLRDIEFDEQGRVVAFSECGYHTVCTPLGESSWVELPPHCESGPGCATLRSDGGRTTLYHRAEVRVRWPVRQLVYEVVAEEDIAAITDATTSSRFNLDRGFLVIEFAGQPDEDQLLSISIAYVDGTRDAVTILING